MFSTKKLLHLAVPVLAAMALSTLVVADATSTVSTSKSSHPSTAKSGAKSASKRSGVPKLPITISLTSTMRRGNLIVALDDMQVFNENFEKPALIISQTTTWDPLQVAAGKHKLRAKVVSGNGKTYLSGTYDLEVSRTKGIELRIRVKGDKLTVEPAS